MTNKERLISLIGFSPAENAAEGALLDLGLLSTDTYDTASNLNIKKAAIEVMKALITTADTSNAQTGFAIKYDRASILKLIAQFEQEVGDTTSLPTITGISPW